MARIEVSDDFYEQTPDGSALATETVMNTIRTADMLLERIGRLLRPLNVSPAGGPVLGLLRDRGPLPPSEISDRMVVTRATVTGVIDSLERRGFVQRVANPADRRSVLIEITPAGLDVLTQVRALVHREEKAWMAVLTDEELRDHLDRLHRIQDGLATSADD